MRAETSEDRARFQAQVKAATRATGISAGAVAVAGYPAWALFDYLVEPANAESFVWLRIGFAIPIALIWLGLVLTPQGRKYPEAFVLGIIYMVVLGIALMIAQIESHYAAYALGMSLTVYASAFLLVWSPRYMAAVIGLNFGSLGLVLLLSDPISTDAIATILFYVGTASLLSFLAQYHRHAMAWREFEGRLALEREQERNRELVVELDRQSREDPLTGLANRRAWDEALARQWAASRRSKAPFALLLFDLDLLKAVNDQYGHATGDRVLQAVGRILKTSVRGGDLVARLGGDEFALLSPGADLSTAAAFAERLRARIGVEVGATVVAGGMTVSVGLSEWAPSDESVAETMLRADRHLYQAKLRRDVVCTGDVDEMKLEA